MKNSLNFRLIFLNEFFSQNIFEDKLAVLKHKQKKIYITKIKGKFFIKINVTCLTLKLIFKDTEKPYKPKKMFVLIFPTKIL